MNSVMFDVSYLLLLSLVLCAPSFSDSSRSSMFINRKNQGYGYNPQIKIQHIKYADGDFKLIPQNVSHSEIKPITYPQIWDTVNDHSKNAQPSAVFKSDGNHRFGRKKLQKDECNESKRFCVVRGYPKKRILKAMKKLNLNLTTYFEVDEFVNTGKTEVEQRNNDENDKANMCETTKIPLFHKVLTDDKKIKNFVINYKGKEQVIMTEQCVNENSKCDVQGSMNVGYDSLCVQKYSKKPLVVYNPGNDSINIVTVPYPSCCSCYQRSLLSTPTRQSYNRQIPAPRLTSLNGRPGRPPLDEKTLERRHF